MHTKQRNRKPAILIFIAAGIILLIGGCVYLIRVAVSGGGEVAELSSGLKDETAEITEQAVDSVEAKNKAASDIEIIEDYRDGFVHGEKPAEFQKYIMLHDTETDSDAASIIDWWDSNGNKVATHFIVNKDGSIYQCVPMDKIAHHAGYGDSGHNDEFGVTDESRDDRVGVGAADPGVEDYGMNSYSVGIEMVHVGGSGDYPEEQLEALDKLIAYIDTYYGFESEITDHKAWRTGNSDTSPEFAGYLENYKTIRQHK